MAGKETRVVQRRDHEIRVTPLRDGGLYLCIREHGKNSAIFVTASEAEYLFAPFFEGKQS